MENKGEGIRQKRIYLSFGSYLPADYVQVGSECALQSTAELDWSSYARYAFHQVIRKRFKILSEERLEVASIMRYTKEMAKDLIMFGRNIMFNFNFWDARSNSGFEFCRQMSSANLQKLHPNFSVKFQYQEEESVAPPMMRAEFSDGSILELDTSKHHAQDLRTIFYDHAAMVSERADGTDGKEESPDVVLSTESLEIWNKLLKERNMEELPLLPKDEKKTGKK